MNGDRGGGGGGNTKKDLGAKEKKVGEKKMKKQNYQKDLLAIRRGNLSQVAGYLSNQFMCRVSLYALTAFTMILIRIRVTYGRQFMFSLMFTTRRHRYQKIKCLGH